MDDRQKDNILKRADVHLKYATAYLRILKAYHKQIEESIKKKNELKGKFFNMIKKIMYILIGLFIVSIISSFAIFIISILFKYKSIEIIAGAITALISSFVTMIVSISKLPEIIAKYLFNKKEDKIMKKIIESIQSYEIEFENSSQKGISKAVNATADNQNNDSQILTMVNEDVSYIQPEDSPDNGESNIN